MAEYFFELLTEEIPAWMHDGAQATLQQQLTQLVAGAEVYVTTTPRRIIFFLSKLPLREASERSCDRCFRMMMSLT